MDAKRQISNVIVLEMRLTNVPTYFSGRDYFFIKNETLTLALDPVPYILLMSTREIG